MIAIHQIFSSTDFWTIIKSIFCLPANLIIEFLANSSGLSSAIQWSMKPMDLINSWSAVCGASVIWVLVVAVIAHLSRPSSPDSAG